MLVVDWSTSRRGCSLVVIVVVAGRRPSLASLRADAAGPATSRTAAEELTDDGRSRLRAGVHAAAGTVASRGDRRRGHRAGPGGRRHRRRHRRSTSQLQAGRPPVDRAVPVPRREDAVVLGERRGASTTASAARPRATSSRSCARSSTSTSSARSSGWPAKAGISSATPTRARARAASERTRLVEAMAQAVDWYHERLLTSPDAGPARGYLRSPGLRRRRGAPATSSAGRPTTGTSWPRRCELPDDGARATPASASSTSATGCRTSSAAGCCSRSSTSQGDPVAFGGRVLPGADGPKYKNSPETPIYAKSKVLYGLNWAKADIVARRRGDRVRGLHRRDRLRRRRACPRAVATCGTALTEDHVRLLKRFAKRVVLAFDADAAGQDAAERFYEWEQKLRASTSPWPACPPGVDPGDLARSDPERAPRRGRPTPRRSSASASTGCSRRPTSARPRVGPAPPRPRWR